MRSPRTAQIDAVAQYSNALRDCQPNLLRQVYGASRSLIHRLFPPSCLLCLEPGQAPALDLCSGCEADLPRTARVCAICAAPVAGPVIACAACLARRPAFDAAFAPYRYEFPLVELIHRLKYGRQVAVARILGTLLGRRLAERGPPAVDALVPVPLHAAREARRGYNQAGEIARFAGRQLGLPVLSGYVRRSRPTAEQVGLGAIERAENLRGAFELLRPLPVARVAIVDDVLTTGSTAEELAALLRDGGAGWIEAWAVARASLSSP